MYGPDKKMNFKKNISNIQIQAEVVEVIDHSKSRNIRGGNITNTPISIR